MPPPGMVYMQPDRQQQQPQFAMRRAGSYNAKMMSQVSFLYMKLSLLHPALLTEASQYHNSNLLFARTLKDHLQILLPTSSNIGHQKTIMVS